MVPNAFNFARITAPDHAVGRYLLRARMWAQLIPLLAYPSAHAHAAEIISLSQKLVPRYTMLSVPRLANLYARILELDNRGVMGAVVECGVWNGGGSATMAAAMATTGRFRDMWLFDSFEGLPPPTAEDPPEVHEAYHTGWCLGSPILAREAVLAMKMPDELLHIVTGWFDATFSTVTIDRIALLHVDADWYAPVKLCLERFYDSVASGGVIVLDDYGRWAGCQIATDEFLKNRNVTPVLHRIDASGVYFIKP